jgi:leader peptidase (prepilin peptidase)/N-methyltransferase
VEFGTLPPPLQTFALIAAIALGAVVGSFLNVCIYRLPRGESIVAPRSYCFSCGARLTFIDLIPLLSFLALRARCRHCGRRFSAQYFFIELASALLFLAAVRVFGVSLQTFCVMAAGAALIVTFMIDLHHYIILDSCVAIVLATGVLLDAYGLIAGDTSFITHQESYRNVELTVYLPRSIVGIVLGAGVFLAIGWVFNRVFGKPALGEGDARLAAGVGAWLGAGYAFFAWFLIAVLAGALIGVLAIALGLKRRREYIPFGPMLAASAIALMLWREPITAWVMSLYGASTVPGGG